MIGRQGNQVQQKRSRAELEPADLAQVLSAVAAGNSEAERQLCDEVLPKLTSYARRRGCEDPAGVATLCSRQHYET